MAARSVVDGQTGVQLPSPTLMSKELIVPEGTNIIINDTVFSDREIGRIFECLGPVILTKWIILNAEELTCNLAPQIVSGITLLFPGEGSQFIKLQLSLPGIDIPTQRIFERNKPTVCNIEIPETLVNTVVENPFSPIGIVDDVVASGQTIQQIRKSLEFKVCDRGINPKIQWGCFTWLRQKRANTEGFLMRAYIEYSKKSGIPAVNSFSTFLQDTEKGYTVTKGYALRYFSGYEQSFYDFIKGLKNRI